MMKILVTGAAGYIGSHIVSELILSGLDVVGLDNFSNSYFQTIDGIQNIVGHHINMENADCSDKASMEMILNKYPDISVIIHLAAYKSTEESIVMPSRYYGNNLVSLLNILDILVQQKKKVHFIFSSSASVYGQVDNAYQPINESCNFKEALSPYARSKQMCEHVLQDYAFAYPNLNIMILRYFNPIGAHPSAYIGEMPKSSSYSITSLITKVAIDKDKIFNIYGNKYNTPDGTCIRDYINIMDLARAHVLVIEYMLDNHIGIDAVNIGSGKGISVLGLIKLFTDTTGIKVNYQIQNKRKDEIIISYANIEKAKLLFNWFGETKIEESLLTAWKWQQYKDNFKFMVYK